MYLVEIETGREELFQSVEALGAAIRGGLIGPDSRIFHRASSSWISITLHPEYRKAMAARAQEPLPPLPRTQWTFFGSENRRLQETPAEPAAAPAEPEPQPAPRGLRALFGRGRRSASDTAEQPGS